MTPVLGMSLPLIGSFSFGFNIGFGLVLFGILALVGGVAAGRKLVGGLPLLGKMLTRGGVALAIVLLLGASFVNPGGLLNGSGPGISASAAVGSSTATFATPPANGTAWDANLYEPTSDVTAYATDQSTQSAVSPLVKVYAPGVDATQAVQGSAVALYQATMSSGKVTISGIQTQTIGCKIDVLLSLSSYYQTIQRNVYICKARNALDSVAVSVPTWQMQAIGTLSLAKTDTTLTCAAATQCSYSLILRNTLANSWIVAPGVNWANSTGAASPSETLDSVDAGGQCILQNVNSQLTVVFTGSQAVIPPLGTITCPLRITHLSGGAAGDTMKFTADDLWQMYGTTQFVANSNIYSATATSATTVTFA